MSPEEILSRIGALHENALVAWDRDGGEVPEEASVHDWRHYFKSTSSQQWTTSEGILREDGLGCVLRHSPLRSVRWVLVEDEADPLGCRWESHA